MTNRQSEISIPTVRADGCSRPLSGMPCLRISQPISAGTVNRDVGETHPQLWPFFAGDRTPASLQPRQHAARQVSRLPPGGSQANLLGAPVIWVGHPSHQPVALQSVEDEIQGLLGDIEPGREFGWPRASSGERWRSADGCQGAPAAETLPSTGDGTVVHRFTSTPCAAGTAVVFFQVDDGGHTWPGGPQYLPKVIIGPTTHAFAVSEAIGQFFVAHGR